MPDERLIQQQPPPFLAPLQQEWVPRLKKGLVAIAQSAKTDKVCIDVSGIVSPHLN